jgi:hypothetical protein
VIASVLKFIICVKVGHCDYSLWVPKNLGTPLEVWVYTRINYYGELVYGKCKPFKGQLLV